MVSDPRHITGQSFVSKISITCVNPQLVNFLDSGLIKTLFTGLMGKSRNKVMYVTASRSLFGSFRDYIFLLCHRPKKIIAHFHGIGFNRSWFFRQNLKRFDLIVAITPYMKELLSDYKEVGCPIKIIENPVLLNFHTTAKEFKKNEKVVYFSNLMRSKGILIFLNLSSRYSNRFSFQIAGRNLDKIIIPDYVDYHGVLKGEKKEKFLLEAKFMIFFSNYVEESFPISLIEALYAGVLPIVKRHNKLEDIFKDYGFIWVDTQEEIECKLSNKVELESDYERFLKLRIMNANQIINRFSIQLYQEKLSAIINSFT